MQHAQTAPEPGLPEWGTAGIEAALSYGLVLTILVMVSSARTARWTPAVVTGVLAGLIWAGAGAPHTGASMNPARTLGPDVVSGRYPALWSYFTGPVLGTLVALCRLSRVGPPILKRGRAARARPLMRPRGIGPMDPRPTAEREPSFVFTAFVWIARLRGRLPCTVAHSYPSHPSSA